MAPRTKRYEGFDPNDVAEAKKDIGDVQERLAKLEDTLGSEDSIVRTLETIYPRVTKLQDIYEACFIRMLDRDTEAKKSLTAYIRRADRERVNEYIGKVGAIAWTLFVALISGAVVYWLKA